MNPKLKSDNGNRYRGQRFLPACGLAVLLTGAAAKAQVVAQPAGVDHSASPVQLWDSGALLERGHALLETAGQGSGSEGVTLTREANQYTMLSARTRSGGAEMHLHYSDYLIVLEGEGTERTGGTMVDAKDGEGGEVRGSTLEGSVEHSLHKGDILFIPAGTPHQAIESPRQTLVLFVIKVAVPAKQDHFSPSNGPGLEPKASHP